MRKLVAVVMAVFALGLGACSPGPKTISVYPEAGNVPWYVTTSQDGKMTCAAGVLATQLTRGGTVRANGVAVAFVATDKGATMTFTGGIPFHGAVVNDKLVVSLPAKTGENTRLNLFNADFGGKVESIALCSGAGGA